MTRRRQWGYLDISYVDFLRAINLGMVTWQTVGRSRSYRLHVHGRTDLVTAMVGPLIRSGLVEPYEPPVSATRGSVGLTDGGRAVLVRGERLDAHDRIDPFGYVRLDPTHLLPVSYMTDADVDRLCGIASE